MKSYTIYLVILCLLNIKRRKEAFKKQIAKIKDFNKIYKIPFF